MGITKGRLHKDFYIGKIKEICGRNIKTRMFYKLSTEDLRMLVMYFEDVREGRIE